MSAVAARHKSQKAAASQIPYTRQGHYMRNRSKQLLVSLCAIALLGIGAGTASATHFQLLEFERGFRIVYPTMEFSTGGFSGTVRCRVTVE